MQRKFCKYDYVYELDRLENAKEAAKKLLDPHLRSNRPDAAMSDNSLTDSACSSETKLSIRHRTRNKKRYTYVYKTQKDADGNIQSAYQNEEALAGETSLIAFYCAEKVTDKVKELKKVLVSKPDSYDPFDIQSLYEDFYSAFGDLTPKPFMPNSIQIQKWLSQKIPRTHMSEQLKQPTDRGDLVRSKYEQAIANVLYELKLPYLYEKPKVLNNTPYLPDFTIIDPLTGKYVYIEAFGMMRDEKYCISNIKKIHDYEAAGCTLGKDFFMVFDDPDSPFNPAAFRRMMLERFF